jgi:sugar lactone lactonase YvrE
MIRPLATLVILGAATANAQGPASPAATTAYTGYAAADSANAARAAWRRANAAAQAGDLATARTEVNRAATAWPTQDAYAWGRVVMAVRANDTTGTIAALNAYADIGLGRDLAKEPATRDLFNAPAFKVVAARHEANRAPLVRSAPRVTLGDSTFWPEGMDHDPRTGAYYLASIRHRTIAEWRDGRIRELLPRGAAHLGAVLAVRADTARGVLWATTSGIPQQAGFVPADSAVAALLRIRIADGTIEKRWDLPVAPGGRVLGDVAIGPRGDIYLSDSQHPELYRLAPGTDSLAVVRHPLFRSLQGIAPSADPNVVYVADYSHGILRVDLSSWKVVRVADAPGSTTLGCDGIVFDRGAIIAVQNGVVPPRVMRFTLDANGSAFSRAEVLDRNPAADEPTIGAIVGREFVYVANSQWEKHDAAGKPLATANLTRPVLLALPIPR